MFTSHINFETTNLKPLITLITLISNYINFYVGVIFDIYLFLYL